MLSNRRKIKIISVSGPTCTGKSDLAMKLAGKLDGEIVNCDSMQVYRHFDIGTAKPERAAMEAVPHHLVDIVEPHEEFNAARFCEEADRAVQDISRRRKTPILVGGTGLYLRALIYGLFEAPKDEPLRSRLSGEYTEDPLGFYESLKKTDPAYALRISHKDKIRAVRAMEIFLLTGKKMSDLEKDHGFKEARYDTLKIGLTGERDELYRRIDKRVDDMLASGWIEEVKRILSIGIPETAKPFTSIGYREIILNINGFIDYIDMVKDIKKHTRHYAKRQLTWFAKEKEMRWFEYPADEKAIMEDAGRFLGPWN